MKNKIQFYLTLACVLFSAGAGFAESGAGLTNEDVIQYVKTTSLTDDQLLKIIRTALETNFDVAPEAMADLTAAGASNAIIDAVIEKYTGQGVKLTTPAQQPQIVTPTVSEKADKWNGLELGVSTLAEVREKLGQPTKEEITDLKTYKVGPAFLDNARKEEVFLALTYNPTKKQSEAYREIIAFLKDDVLLGLALDSRKDARQDPQGLINYFEGVEFHDFVNGWEEGAAKGNGRYERLGEEVSVNNYGMDYAVWGKSNKTLIVLEVRQPKKNFFKEIGTGIFDKTDRRRPGKVHRVYFYSRALEPKASLSQN